MAFLQVTRALHDKQRRRAFGYYVLGLASALRLVSGVAVLHLDYTNDIELPSLLNSCDAQTLFFFGGFHSQI